MNRKQLLETGGGLANTKDLMPVEDLAASTLSAESIEGFGGLEVGLQHQALLAEDPPQPGTSGAGCSCGGRSATNNIEVQGSNTPTQITSWQHQPGGAPFLDLQQAGFDMLGKELVGRLSTCLSRMEMLLRPLGRIADNLGRLAEAVERVVPAATPPPSPSTRSPPFNRST